jgi:hypothetical protein
MFNSRLFEELTRHTDGNRKLLNFRAETNLRKLAIRDRINLTDSN